jgi:hypothetical protein
MQRVPDFRELLEADEGLLRDLVRFEGDALERVWAAWSLALRHDASLLDVVRQAAKVDPSPGVRAHMALLLVAHGELDAAMALARGDPDELVRASACRHLARVAKPDDTQLQELLETAMRSEPSSAVRAAIADGVRFDASAPVWRACVDRLLDPDEEVRANVIEAMLRRHAPRDPFPLELTARATTEESPRLRVTILRAWANAEGGPGILSTLTALPTPDVVRMLLALQEACVHVDAEDLDALLDRKEPSIDGQAVTLHRLGLVKLPLHSLLELATRLMGPWTPAAPGRWDAMRLSLDALSPLLAKQVHVSPRERAAIDNLREAIEREVSATGLQEGDVDKLVRYARGELDGADYPSGWENEGIDIPPGIELLPELRRLGE